MNNNYIEELNIDKNIYLTSLVCDNNLLKTLNVSTNKALRHISCNNNLIKQAEADKIAFDLLQQTPIKKGKLIIINQHNNRKIEITENLLALQNAGWSIL